MELLKGVTVEEFWPSMTDDEKAGLWKSVQAVVENLRKVTQEPNDRFIGQINRGSLYHHALDNSKQPRLGPFASLKEFHDWLSIITTPRARNWPGKEIEEIIDPYRHMVPDDAAIVFTHADLHPSNIMVDAEDLSRIIAVIDWGQSGWWPDYWESCKGQWTSEYGDYWHQHLVKYLEVPDEVTQYGFENYVRSLGN